ncbi:hypothetical protein FOL47_004297 [Perkinsus chesapeaki]|uniref:Uncharacterized protein n=1 Tax=Perkinsus chesapeaki TaxID=330153 RepID=A0A7J6M3G8_PERCH|nr:hypothetical protein FOL47_004297 [Perkinsus chesapeaki]
MFSSPALLLGCLLAASSNQALADHADDIVTLLNKRFNEGGPTNDLSKAGVLMHQWDGLGAEDYQQSWRPYTPEECSNSSSHANCQYSDRISCLLINNDVRNPGDGRIPLYTYTRGGTVEDPDFTQYGTFKASYPNADVPLLVLDYNAEESPFFKADNTQMYTTGAPTTGNGLMTTPSYGTTQSGWYPESPVTTSPEDADGQAGSTSNAYGKSITLAALVGGFLLFLNL